MIRGWVVDVQHYVAFLKHTYISYNVFINDIQIHKEGNMSTFRELEF